jgi:hypothetical protein
MNNVTGTVSSLLAASSRAKVESPPDTDPGRRRFLKINLLALALAPTASVLVSETAWALRNRRNVDKSPAILDPGDPQAEALSYTGDSSKENQSCSNCQLYSGTSGEAIGPCAIFSYRVAPNNTQIMVSASGWCRAWGPRQSA